MKIENGKIEFYSRVKDMIRQLSRKCSDFNIKDEPLIIPSNFTVPEYKIKKYYLTPENIYIYKIYMTKEPSIGKPRVLPISKIIICTEEIQNCILMNQGINTSINDDRVDWISMTEEADKKRIIRINVRKPRSNQIERYFISKESDQPTDNENAYTVDYIETGNNIITRDNDNTFLQQRLNEIIPSRGIEEVCSTIRGQLNEIEKIAEGTNDLHNTTVKQSLENVARILESLIKPAIEL